LYTDHVHHKNHKNHGSDKSDSNRQNQGWSSGVFSAWISIYRACTFVVLTITNKTPQAMKTATTLTLLCLFLGMACQKVPEMALEQIPEGAVPDLKPLALQLDSLTLLAIYLDRDELLQAKGLQVSSPHCRQAELVQQKPNLRQLGHLLKKATLALKPLQKHLNAGQLAHFWQERELSMRRIIETELGLAEGHSPCAKDFRDQQNTAFRLLVQCNDYTEQPGDCLFRFVEDLSLARRLAAHCFDSKHLLTSL
jgi:hypothetical protein